MQEVGAFDARNKLGTLLDWVERGEEVVITRRGKAVARLVSFDALPNAVQAQNAADRIRARAKALGMVAFDWPAWKSLRDEGRP